ncbi:MAG: hypothetical protein AAGJ31_03505, partial [Verrucomicrobiota bacterium]
MRAITLAESETGYFEPGKVAATGVSKNGATPSMAILHDDRLTAVFGQVSPIWESPLRLFDRTAWDALEAQWGPVTHRFLGGHFGPNFHREALRAGQSWEELEQFAEDYSDQVFVSLNLEKLEARGAEMMFAPGTHDFVAFDMAWGGKHYPSI